MADLLSIVASSIAVIQAADAIISFCKGYIEAVRDAPSDIRRILVEVVALKAVFEPLKCFAEVENAGLSRMFLNILEEDGPIQGCERCMKAIQDELKLTSDTTDAAEEPTKRHHHKLGSLLSTLALRMGKKGKEPPKQQQEQRRGLSDLRWPLKKGKVLKLLDEVAGYKATITLAISSESMEDTKHVKKQVQEVHEQLSDSKIHDICDWLVDTNPSTLYNTSRDQYTPGTGNWVLRSTEWSNWTSGKFRSLWFHGIPGAGKTVLAGYLIREIHKIYGNEDRVTSVYYYCYHAHNQDELVPMLKWVISQLSRTSKFVAPGLLRTYEQRHQPSVEDLLECLEDCLKHFNAVYLVIDALDESHERQNILGILKVLVDKAGFEKIRLLTTSREYFDIQETLSKISTEIPMSNPLVEEDIRTHVSYKLRTEPRFQKWSIELLGEVEEALTKGAQGMFRWAVCQIDILRRQRSASMHDIREALKTLPKTLDETYDRIFSLIEPHDQALVRHALAWICFQDRLSEGHRVRPSVLLESFYRIHKTNTYAKSDPKLNRDDLQDMCGCLLTFQPREGFGPEHEIVLLAHYTVREYLSSDRILQGPASVYALNPSLDNEAFLDMSIKTAQESKLTVKEVQYYNWADYIIAFRPYCVHLSCRCIRMLEDEICRSDHLTTLVCNFIHSSPELVQASDFGQDFDCHFQYDRSDNDQVDATCLGLLLTFKAYKVAGKFSNLLRNRGTLPRILSTAITVDSDGTPNDVCHPAGRYYDNLEVSGTLLDIMAQVGWNEAYQFLLQRTDDAGAATTALILSVGCHYDGGVEFDDKCRLQMALQAGAYPNTPGAWATALQIAVACRDLDGVQSLIKAGADVNGLGDEGAGMWEKDTLMGRFNFLHDLSPLYICRIPKCICFQEDEFEEEHLFERSEIEQLLLSYGAKDTVRNGEYLDFEYRIDWKSGGYTYWARWERGKLLDDGRDFVLPDTDSEGVSEDEATSDDESDLE